MAVDGCKTIAGRSAECAVAGPGERANAAKFGRAGAKVDTVTGGLGVCLRRGAPGTTRAPGIGEGVRGVDMFQAEGRIVVGGPAFIGAMTARRLGASTTRYARHGTLRIGLYKARICFVRGFEQYDQSGRS